MNTKQAMKPLEITIGPCRAIFTRYLGPTNTRGSRIKAFDCEGNSATVPMDNSKRDDDSHRAAVEKLCRKMNWSGRLASGGTKDGMVFVFVEHLAPANSVCVEFANTEDCAMACKILAKQQGNPAQTLQGIHAGLLASAMQRAVKVTAH